MEKLFKEFYANHTELEVIEMVLGWQYCDFEKLRKERNILEQATPLDETSLQQNTDTIEYVQKAIGHYENVLELQKKNQ